MHKCINKKHLTQSTNLAHNHGKTKHNKITKHYTQTNPELGRSPSLPIHISTYLKEKIKEARPKGLIQHQHIKKQTQITNPTTPKHIITNKRVTNEQHTNTYTIYTKQITTINKKIEYINAHINIKRIKNIINKAFINTPKEKQTITQQKQHISTT